MTPHSALDLVARIVNAYDDPVSRAYCRVRFRILRPAFLEEIRQYLPKKGSVLELGCGFGLFSLYFAMSNPEIHVHGVDLSERRIALARGAAEKLGIRNATFECKDVREIVTEGAQWDAVYVLDVLHHLGRSRVPAMLATLRKGLRDGGVLIVKDIDTRPFHQMAFTWLLDVVVTRGELPEYWSAQSLTQAIHAAGFRVFSHPMADVLPFSHRLYFCPVDQLASLQGAEGAPR